MLIDALLLMTLIVFWGFLYVLKHRHVSLSRRILLSLCFGSGYGWLLKYSTDNLIGTYTQGILELAGSGYLALLKMLVTPLILTSIIYAILNLGTDNSSSIKKMSIMVCSMLLGMTALASLIGMGVAVQFQVGQGLQLPDTSVVPDHIYTGFVATLLGMLPSNPISAMSQQNTIAIVLFAVFLGIAARMLDKVDHDKMETFRKLVSSLFAVVKKLAGLVIALTPYGISALLAELVFKQGLSLFAAMLNFIAAMYVAMLLVMLMHSIILMMAGYNPCQYFKKAYAPLLVAFTTRSSFGTLPIAEETLRDKFNASQIIATFVPSAGATMGMNACAGIFPAVLVVMTLTIMHQPLTLHTVCMVMFINAIASLGISGIPGTAYIAATVTLTSLNLPYSVVALVQGVDPIVDMGRTATNVNGVMTTALTVDKLIAKPSAHGNF